MLPPQNRTLLANATLAVPLCSVAGSLNAATFLVLGMYTSHVTGTWSRVAAELAQAHWGLAWTFLRLALTFILGAMAATYLIESNLHVTRRVRYLKPLTVELCALIAFIALGRHYEVRHEFPEWLATLVTFAMGLQNATITKVSGAVVRTTHMTGITTDLGIESTRLLLITRDYLRSRRRGAGAADPFQGRSFRRVFLAEAERWILLVCILFSFMMGGLAGGALYVRCGILGMIPACGVLGVLVAIEIAILHADKDVLGPQVAMTRRLMRTPDLGDLDIKPAPASTSSPGPSPPSSP